MRLRSRAANRPAPACGLILAALLAAGCTPAAERQQTALMDQIESRIRLPEGAQPLASYARAYKFSRGGVDALYFIPARQPDRASCEAARQGGGTNGQTLLLCPPPEGLGPGERRWLDSSVTLPGVSDGGCHFIDVRYDVQARSIKTAQCHGEA